MCVEISRQTGHHDLQVCTFGMGAFGRISQIIQGELHLNMQCFEPAWNSADFHDEIHCHWISISFFFCINGKRWCGWGNTYWMRPNIPPLHRKGLVYGCNFLLRVNCLNSFETRSSKSVSIRLCFTARILMAQCHTLSQHVPGLPMFPLQSSPCRAAVAVFVAVAA